MLIFNLNIFLVRIQATPAYFYSTPLCAITGYLFIIYYLCPQKLWKWKRISAWWRTVCVVLKKDPQSLDLFLALHQCVTWMSEPLWATDYLLVLKYINFETSGADPAAQQNMGWKEKKEKKRKKKEYRQHERLTVTKYGDMKGTRVSKKLSVL